jgi:hypothetical protein
MALPVRLFFKGNRIYGVGNIAFDLVLSETHNFTSKVTSHPVEDGSEITDHIYNDLENGSINGLISNFSLNSTGAVTNRAQSVFEALISLWRERTPVTIRTVMRVYENVVITSMPFLREASQGESLPISISFRKIEVVKLEEITVELSIKVADLSTDINKQVSPEVNVGETSTTSG